MDLRNEITTGVAAGILGCSRQHVVDLCDQGVLRSISPGVHRRLRRDEVEAFARQRTSGELTADQLRSLWLHRAVAAHVARDPERAFEIARENIRRSHDRGPAPGTDRWLRRWQELIARGPEPVMGMLTSRSPIAREMRQSSPFAGVLPEEERLAILRSAARYGPA
jgi:excisionase family DNA binding protein